MAHTKDLFGTSYSVGWLQEAIEKSVGGTNVLRSSSAELIGEGKGFMSKVIRVCFVWDNPGDRKFPKSVVLKVPNTSAVREFAENLLKGDQSGGEKVAAAKAMKAGIDKIHSNECEAYEWFAKRHNSGVPVPRTYARQKPTDNKPGAIVMQDFHDKAAQVKPEDGLSLAQARNVVSGMAQWHASSLLNTGWAGRFRLIEKSDLQNVAAIFAKSQQALRQLQPDYFARVEEAAGFFDGERMLDTALHSAEKCGVPEVLVHGDLWMNNVLFDERQTDKVLAVLDWQGAHPGNGMQDVARLLITSVDGQTRRDQTQNRIGIYHQSFTKAYGKKAPFTQAQLTRAYEHMLTSETPNFLIALPPLCAAVGDDDAKKERLLLRGKLILEDLLKLGEQ